MARRSATKAAQSETDESVDSQVEEVDQPTVEEEAPEESEAPEVEDDESDEELDSVVEEDESDEDFEDDESEEDEDDESEEDDEDDESESDEEPTQAPKAKAPKAEPADLGPFQEAATAAVEEADESTGELPEEAIASVNKVYREIEGVKGKNQARTWIDEQMKAAITGKGEFESLDQTEKILKARAYVSLKDGLSAGAGSAAPKAPADPTQAFIQKVAALRIGLDELTSNVPEGVSDEWEQKAGELVDSLADEVDRFRDYQQSSDSDAEQPEVSPVVRQAFKLALGKGMGGGGRISGGPRRDIEQHMIQVFADLNEGDFLTVNEIAKTASSEYGDDRPSPGAVSAR